MAKEKDEKDEKDVTKTPELSEAEQKIAAAKKEIEEGYRDLVIMQKRFKREVAAHEAGGKGKRITLPEFGGAYDAIERVTEHDVIRMKEMAEMEKFGNEKLRIRVEQSGVPGDLPVIVVTVNGTNQAIIRGHEQFVRRKYVESLARSRVTNYSQSVPDGSKPDVISMNDHTSPTYPFTVLEDPHPRGKEWLLAILAQP